MATSKKNPMDELRDAVFSTKSSRDVRYIHLATSFGWVCMSSDGRATWTDGTPCSEEAKAEAKKLLIAMLDTGRK